MFSDTSSFKLLKPLDVKNLAADKTAIEIDKLNLYYGQKQALHDISMRIPKGKVTAFIGPSGCGKSTIMRSINRMNDLIEGCKITGNIRLHGHDVYAPEVDVSALRRR